MRPENYRVSFWAAVIVTVVLAMLGAATVAADPLELTKQQVALIGVATAGLGVLNGFLPRVNKPPSDDRRGRD